MQRDAAAVCRATRAPGVRGALVKCRGLRRQGQLGRPDAPHGSSALLPWNGRRRAAGKASPVPLPVPLPGSSCSSFLCHRKLVRRLLWERGRASHALRPFPQFVSTVPRPAPPQPTLSATATLPPCLPLRDRRCCLPPGSAPQGRRRGGPRRHPPPHRAALGRPGGRR